MFLMRIQADGREFIMIHDFFMPMIPPTVTAQEKRIGGSGKKRYTYDTPEIKTAKEKLTAHLAKHAPDKPYECGVRLTVLWLFPLKGAHKDGEYKTSKPDTDNLQKLFKDCMTRAGFWRDDALVASELCEKFWAKLPGIYVKVESL